VTDAHDLGAVLSGEEARLVLHLLGTFERLLRLGELDERQLALLTPPGTGRPERAADLFMATVVAEAAAVLRRQDL
jgi:hypothetical protein